MRVLLVANYKPDLQKSMARYAEFLHSELLKRGHEAVLVYPAPVCTRLVSRNSRLFRWLGYIDKFVLFPPILRRRSRVVDIVHICDHSNSAYLRWTADTPNLITAHDALAIRSALGHFPQNPTRWSGVRLQRWIRRGLAGAKNIVCVSQKTRQDFEALLPPGPRMTVIHNPISPNFRPSGNEDIVAMRATLGLSPGDEYLLHVGGRSWYKNRPGVFRIFARLKAYPRFRQVRLVVAGAPLSQDLRRAAQDIGDVIECHGPSDDQLRALYAGALALLFPSLEEGFGWPVLEAQACGCPVITSARPPMSEVAGNAAILIDPEDTTAAAAMIAARIGEAHDLRQAGLVNVLRFSAENVIDRYCEIYSEVLSHSPQRVSRENVS